MNYLVQVKRKSSFYINLNFGAWTTKWTIVSLICRAKEQKFYSSHQLWICTFDT